MLTLRNNQIQAFREVKMRELITSLVVTLNSASEALQINKLDEQNVIDLNEVIKTALKRGFETPQQVKVYALSAWLFRQDFEASILPLADIMGGGFSARQKAQFLLTSIFVVFPEMRKLQNELG